MFGPLGGVPVSFSRGFSAEAPGKTGELDPVLIPACKALTAKEQAALRADDEPIKQAEINNANAALKLVQFLGHPWSAIAAQAQPVLIADMGEEHHVPPLAMRRGPVLPGMEPAF
ncbi:hypothetical protein EV663_1151 [Rhodovulum bhavnagarense]|uniref:Uncharacterized protein n=1 Tax=Rhodovulum bhavnagarense TaxID=992286 RepID=A0A4R2RJD9_9RHOB|nr:hypothetical protein EV663_1151 [Rhodovulum bhavnagarense]